MHSTGVLKTLLVALVTSGMVGAIPVAKDADQLVKARDVMEERQVPGLLEELRRLGLIVSKCLSFLVSWTDSFILE